MRTHHAPPEAPTSPTYLSNRQPEAPEYGWVMFKTLSRTALLKSHIIVIKLVLFLTHFDAT